MNRKKQLSINAEALDSMNAQQTLIDSITATSRVQFPLKSGGGYGKHRDIGKTGDQQTSQEELLGP